MLTSLRFRLWLTYVLVAGATVFVAVIAVVVYLLRNPAEDRKELLRLRLTASVLLQRSQLFAANIENYRTPRLQETLERVDTAFGIRASVFSSNGELMADSRTATAPGLPAWSVFREKPVGTKTLYLDDDGNQWLYTITPVQGGYYLLLSTPRLKVPVMSILRDEFLAPFARGIIIALLLSLLLAFWIARWISAPLQTIADATHSVSVGEFSKIPLEGPQEVRILARSFNEMGQRVQASQRSQRDFIANVSHDLKTPLTSIQGFAQAILDGAANTPDALHQAASVIFTEAERMHRMVQDLLELARLDSGVALFERAPLDICELLRSVVEKFSLQASQAQVDLQFIEQVEASFDGHMIGDVDRLAQVFTNLVDNALKYTPSHGQVDVMVKTNDGWVEVYVSDTGQGISEDELERIFERFYQTDKSRSSGSRRGIGLGLAISKEIIQAHGGTISAHNRKLDEVHSQVARNVEDSFSGSVFLVKLPVSFPDDVTVAKRR